MVTVGNIASEELKQFITRIENLEEEKANVMNSIKEVYDDAKSHGFEVKIMRQIIRERKKEEHERDEEEMLLITYKRALGMIPELDNATE